MFDMGIFLSLRNVPLTSSFPVYCTWRGVAGHGGINKIEWPRGVNLIYSAGGDPLCTLHRAEGLYG